MNRFDSTPGTIDHQLAIIEHASAVARSLHARFSEAKASKLAAGDFQSIRRSIAHLESAVVLLEQAMRDNV